MPDQLQLRGGTTVEHSTFIGASKEVTVDTTKKTVVVHDGTTTGGIPVMREDASNSALGLGSAGTPSIKFTGDLDTGIYSPGANQVAVATNGTQRLLIDSAGGVTVPTRFIIGSVNNVGGLSETTLVGAGVFNTSRLVDGGTNPYLQTGAEAGIVYFNADGTSVPAIAFRTGGTERLRITAAGLVGIGTSAPIAPLDCVTGSSGAIFRYDSASTYFSILPGDANGAVVLRTSANNGAAPNLQFQNDAGQTRMTITDAGNVGIGTTSPGGQLDCYTSTYQRLLVTYPSTYVTKLQLGSFGYIQSDAGTDAYTIDAGTASSANIRFNTYTGERARIDSSGRLLVGTSSARSNFFGDTVWSGLLQIEAFASTAKRVASFVYGNTDAGGPRFVLGKTRSTTVGNNLVSNNDEAGSLSFQGADGASLIECAKIEALIDGTPGTNDMPGRLVFSTTADGAANPTERMRIDNAGRVLVGTATANTSGAKLQTSDGITFPATQVASADPNTLDDYEEGTWTPTIGGTATYSLQSGFYTKVGRIVYVQFAIEVTILGTGSTTQISGLPFNASTGNSSGSCHYFGNLATNIVYLVPEINTAFTGKIVFGALTAAGGTTTTVTIFQNGTRIDGTACYMAA